MVEPQGPGMAHVGAQGVDKGLVTPSHQPRRVEWRQTPVLAHGTERVGRRTNVHAQRVHLRLRPGVGAAFVHAHGQVAVQAQAHAQSACMGLRGGELLVGQPLQPEEVVHPLGMLLGELHHRCAMDVAVGSRPCGPAPHRGVGGKKMGL